MRDPEFAAAYRALEPEFQIAREVIRLRLQQGLSQEELAQMAGTAQPNISRLERGTINPSLHFLRRVAAALGTELEIRFRPREGMDKKELSKTTAGETAAPTYMYPE